MNFHPFIFNWRNQFQKSSRTEEQLLKTFGRVTVINSDEENTPDHWVNVGDSYWFGDQFLKALELFDGDVLLHIQGDVTFNNWEQLKEDAIKDFEKHNWGVYAPHADFTEWTSRRANIIYPPLPDNRSLVACPDCSCWMIHKDIIQEFNNLNLELKDHHLGFGFDMLMCSVSHKSSRPVIRNYNHTVDHPKGTGYNVTQAHVELKELWNKMPVEHQNIVNNIYSKPSQLGMFYVESG